MILGYPDLGQIMYVRYCVTPKALCSKMDIVESIAIHESDVYHYDTPEGFDLYQQFKEQKALSSFSSKYGFLLPLLHAYRETKISADQVDF